MPDKIKVLIVDDSPYSRQTIKEMIETDKELEVLGVASNGIEAMAKTLKLKPDVITLDFEMPEMDGFSFLRWIMKERPMPVIMVTSYSDSATVFRALELGAVDFVAKPSKRASMELHNIRDNLIDKIKGTRILKMDRVSISRGLIEQTSDDVAKGTYSFPPEAPSPDIRVVTIGASTGGPTALQIVLTRLPAQFPAAVLISQHMPKGFTKAFAERLARLSRIRIKEAADGDIVDGGRALLCPGGYHMTLKKKSDSVQVALKESTQKDRYVPSVDLMMSHAAEQFGSATMGVVLTGMGNDGKNGVVEIKNKGGYTIAEAESTAVIFGMPNEAIKTGAVDRVLPLHKIAGEITMTLMGKRDKKWKKN
jgi:two-component system chemotaxis response regulator CheB